MSRLAYFRVSTTDQSIESQRAAMGGNFDREFADEGVSGATPAKDRKGFAALLDFIREGDSLHVYAVDRLGRDALDVQATVRHLLTKGVEVHVHGLGVIAKGVGELILAVLAQVADMERHRIIERTAAGRQAARESLERTGKTHNGKASMGRPQAADPHEVKAWKDTNGASIAKTAARFGLSTSTVKRYVAQA
ncbi:MAG TPA: recombinase family protein [Polaromonas sp.]|nr:recombinase family protein [Polaromonas sp.]